MNRESKTPDLGVILYSGPNCSLCEKAKQVAWPVLSVTGHRLREVDITSDVELLRRYRLSIPVLRQANGRELNWPFDENDLAIWLQDEHEET